MNHDELFDAVRHGEIIQQEDLSGLDLGGADLSGAIFEQVRFPVAMQGALLKESSFVECDFASCDLSELERQLSEDTGFQMESHLLEFLGRCPECQKVAALTAATTSRDEPG